MHEAALIENTLFPKCRKCKKAVRFVLTRPLLGKSVLPFRSTELLEEYQDIVRQSRSQKSRTTTAARHGGLAARKPATAGLQHGKHGETLRIVKPKSNPKTRNTEKTGEAEGKSVKAG